jgi:hypothetical protein
MRPITLMLTLTIAATAVLAADTWVHPATQGRTPPTWINGTTPPTATQLQDAGWRLWDGAEPALASGMERLSRSLTQDPAHPERAVMQVVDGNIAERLAREQAARLADFAATQATNAVIFRATLRRHFGAGAETNRAVTATVVAGYFTGKQVAGTITAQELADAVVLDKLFEALRQWNGTDETWTLPWEYVP